MSIHIVLFLLTKIIPMSCHQHFAHSAWKLFPRKLFRKIIPRCNLHIGIISDSRGHPLHRPHRALIYLSRSLIWTYIYIYITFDQWFPSPRILFSNGKAQAADLPCISPRSWWVVRRCWGIRRSASSPPRDCRRWRSCKCHHHRFQTSHLCLGHLVTCEEWGSEEVEWIIMESF